MGCITSKVLTRSGSFQEELKHSLRRRDSKGFHIATNSGRDHQQFLALVYSNSSVPANYSDDQRYSSATNVEPIDYLGTKKGATTWEELLAGLEKASPRVESSANIVNAPKRSTSFHWSREHDLSIQGSSIVDDKEKRGIERCRSFHTVEEYEKLVKANSCIDTSLDVDQEMKSKSGFSVPEPQLVTSNHCCDSVVLQPTTNFEDASRRADVGSRRKAMAKELTSLKIPSTMELPAIASLKDWVAQVEEQVLNASPPEVCADTPKFGSFDVTNTTSNEKCHNGDGGSADSNSVFDPEMLYAIEEAMQQLETEEERVLKLIEDADITR